MVAVNLLPEAYLMGRARRVRIRRWAMALIISGIAGAAPVVLNLTASAHAESLKTKIAPRRVKLRDQRGVIQTLDARALRLGENLAQADALRSKRDWVALLASVTGPMPDALWLTEVRSIQRQSTRLEIEDGEEGRSTVILAGPAGLEIHGFALDHQPLYEFITMLKGSRLFDAIELTQAGKEPVLAGQAVRFVMTCTW